MVVLIMIDGVFLLIKLMTNLCYVVAFGKERYRGKVSVFSIVTGLNIQFVQEEKECKICTYKHNNFIYNIYKQNPDIYLPLYIINKKTELCKQVIIDVSF